MAFENPKQKKMVVISVLILFIIILAVAFILKGKEGIWSLLKTIFFLGLISSILLGVGLILYHLFFKQQRVDVTYKHKQGLVRAGKISKPDFMRELWCKGDKTHQAVKVGKIIGYLRIENYDNTKKQAERQEDVFIVQSGGFLSGLIGEPTVVRVKTDEWEGLSKVYLKGINLVEIGQYYYLNQDMLNFDAIDKTLKSEAVRDVTLDSYSDYLTLLKRAEGLDTEFNKEMDKKKLLKMPMVNNEDQK